MQLPRAALPAGLGGGGSPAVLSSAVPASAPAPPPARCCPLSLLRQSFQLLSGAVFRSCSSAPTPRSEQRRPRLAAQHRVRSGGGHLRGWRLHGLSGKPVPGLEHPHNDLKKKKKDQNTATSKKSQVAMEPPVCPLVPCASRPALGTAAGAGLRPLCSLPAGICTRSRHPPELPPFLAEQFQISQCIRRSRTLVVFGAPCWAPVCPCLSGTGERGAGPGAAGAAAQCRAGRRMAPSTRCACRSAGGCWLAGRVSARSPRGAAFRGRPSVSGRRGLSLPGDRTLRFSMLSCMRFPWAHFFGLLRSLWMAA